MPGGANRPLPPTVAVLRAAGFFSNGLGVEHRMHSSRFEKLLFPQVKQIHVDGSAIAWVCGTIETWPVYSRGGLQPPPQPPRHMTWCGCLESRPLPQAERRPVSCSLGRPRALQACSLAKEERDRAGRGCAAGREALRTRFALGILRARGRKGAERSRQRRRGDKQRLLTPRATSRCAGRRAPGSGLAWPSPGHVRRR